MEMIPIIVWVLPVPGYIKESKILEIKKENNFTYRTLNK